MTGTLLWASMADRPLLQLALDVVETRARALQIAREAVAGGIDWIEAGTPLIKTEGLDIVRALRREFAGKVICADMKVMDTGKLEAELAAKSGADIIHVLGAADDETVREAVEAAAKYSAKVAVDLINVADPAARALEVQEMGASYVYMHVGIDAQMRGIDPLEALRAVVAAVDIPVAAAGGITAASAPALAAAGASILVVGGAITKAADCTAATRLIIEALEGADVGDLVTNRKYGPTELREAFGRVSTANISDAMHRGGALQHCVPVQIETRRMVGQARTCITVDGDWAKPVELIAEAGEGDVLVIDAGAGPTAMWGELATHSCVQQGIAGVVVDGTVRDIDEIRATGLPVFSRFQQPNAGEPIGVGELDVMVKVFGQRVRPGDWIIGDQSGVVVVPEEQAVLVANRALNVMEFEERLRTEIQRGSTLAEVVDLYRWEKEKAVHETRAETPEDAA